jgi:tight adherence protein B
MTLVAAGAAALAAWWAAGPPPGSVARRAFRPHRVVARGGLAPTAFVLVGAGLPLLVGGRRLALALILMGAAGATTLLVRRARRARAADLRRAQVVEVCEALVGELRAGQPFVAALQHCRETWPDLEPVVAAARLDADVPAALRRQAERPGAEGLREVASAWQVSRRTGSGLAAALGQVADTARARQGTQALVRGELASAQATARLVALLPIASLAMSAGVGGDPWQFLLGTPAGLVCLGLGCAFGFTGLLWIDHIAARVLRTGG